MMADNDNPGITHYVGDSCPGGHAGPGGDTGRYCPDIGLIGWMRSGKDSVADWLVEHYGYHKMGFAMALKEEVARGVGCIPTELDREPLKSQVRQVLQVWGTEFRRGQDPDYWVSKAKEQVRHWRAAHDRSLVFTDVRFQNEINMLCDHGFLIVHVDMLMSQVADYFRERGKTPAEIEAMLSHPSEVEWQYAKADARLESRRGDLPGLYTQVAALVKRHTVR